MDIFSSFHDTPLLLYSNALADSGVPSIARPVWRFGARKYEMPEHNEMYISFVPSSKSGKGKAVQRGTHLESHELSVKRCPMLVQLVFFSYEK